MPTSEVRIAARFLVPLVAGGLLFLTGCPGETPTATKTGTTAPTAKGKPEGKDDHDHDHDHGHHHHAEKGPHDGALVAIGHDDAHLEIVLDAETGKLTAYVLDGEAAKPIAIKQKTLQLAITLEPGHDAKGHDAHEKDGDDKKEDQKKDEVPETALTLTLAAVSPDADGKASEFSGQSDELKGAKEFEAALTAITVGDEQFQGVNFKYPEGNEHDHHH
jgi:hypothetical protein